MVGADWWWMSTGFIIPVIVIVLVVGAVRTRRGRHRTDDASPDRSGPRLGVAPTTSSLVVGGDHVVVHAASNQTEAELVAGALAGESVDATVRLTGAAGYGAREYSVLVPLDERERAERILRDLERPR